MAANDSYLCHGLEPLPHLLLFLIGILGGILAGLLGIGGGVIFIAVLPTFLISAGVPESVLPGYTVANSLFGTFFSALSSVVSQHFHDKALPYGRAVKTGITAALFASLSFWLIVRQPWYSKEVFSWVVIVLLVGLLIRSVYSLYVKVKHTEIPPEKPVFLSIVGAFSGTVSSLSGLGGGVIVVPALRFMGRYPVPTANFISSFTIATSSLAAILISVLIPEEGSVGFGYLVPAVSVPLAVGVVLGAPIGVRLVKRLSQTTITLLYCLFVGIVLVKYLYGLIAG